MLEDKLNTSQRLRLEALSQSIMAGIHQNVPTATSTESIIKRAQEFEKYIAGKIEESSK